MHISGQLVASSLWWILWLQIGQSNARTTAAPQLTTKSSGPCPATSPISPIPGCWGADACAYIIVPDEQQCSQNYCSCGPNDPAPLITESRDGTLSTHCQYTTFPPSQCPTGTSGPESVTHSNGGDSGPVTVDSTYVIDGVAFVGNPRHGFIAPSATITPGGPPAIVASFTFSLPVSDSDSDIYVDGVATKLPPAETASANVATPVTSSSPPDRVTKSAGNPSKTSGNKASSTRQSSLSTNSPGKTRVSTSPLGSSKKGSPPSSSPSHSSSGTKGIPSVSSSNLAASSATGARPSSSGGLLTTEKTKTPRASSSPLVGSLTSGASPSVSVSASISAPTGTKASNVWTISSVTVSGNRTSALTVGAKTITPGGPPATVSSHTFSIPASATGNVVNVDGTTTTLSTRAAVTGGPSSAPSVYTIDGIPLTGNPTSLSAAGASAALTPGAPPLVVSGHTFSIPVSATSGAINVDGTLTTLPTHPASVSNVNSKASAPTSASNSAAPGLGPGFGPVGQTTFTQSGTTYTYDQAVISAYTTVGPTPTVATVTFPEYDSKGQVTSVIGPVIIGEGGHVIIHPPKIGPPGFGGPIRPPSSGKDCPSFFGIQLCPPGFNLPSAGGSGTVDPDDLPEGTDPENPDNEEDNTSTDKETKTQEKQSTTRSSPKSSLSSLATTTRASSTVSSSRRSSSSASSSVSSCSATGCGCAEYDYGPLATPDPLDDESQDTFKRALAGRVMYKRASSNSITRENVGQGKCPVSKYTAKPTYPGPTAISANEGNQGKTANPNMEAFYATATYWAVATTAPKCAAPGWEWQSTPEILAQKPDPYKIGGGGKQVNTDHVYEVSILDEFFASQITAGFACQDIATLFDVEDTEHPGSTRLNTIFGQVASFTNPDFVGMDGALNALKGSLWNPDLSGNNMKPKKTNNIRAYIQSLFNVALIMSIENDGKVQGLFQSTNNRIYNAFRGIDNLITQKENCGDPIKDAADKPMSATWGEAYTKYIEQKIASQNDLVSQTAKEFINAVPTDAAQPQAQGQGQGNINNWSTQMSSFNEKFPLASMTFPAPGAYAGDPLNIQKRDGACSLQRSSVSTPSSAKVSLTSGPSLASKTGHTTNPAQSARSASAGGSGSTPSTASITPAPSKHSATAPESSGSAATATDDSPLCIPNGEKNICVCSTGTIIQTISSYLNPTSNICGYTTLPSTTASPTSPATTKTGYVYTLTDPNFGWVVECTSTDIQDVAGYQVTECAGGITTVSTVSSIASAGSVYGASVSSVSAASAASASSASAAAASPTARILITYYTYENEGVYLYQYRAYDGGDPSQQIDYCWSATPIAYVDITKDGGDTSVLPTDQLGTFTTHGIKGCSYNSSSSKEAGTLNCPGWKNPVQCTSVVGSDAKEYQCPTLQGGTEQEPIVDCDWGADP